MKRLLTSNWTSTVTKNSKCLPSRETSDVSIVGPVTTLLNTVLLTNIRMKTGTESNKESDSEET